ncbi:hypothetical protein VWX35_10995 [Phaeobacter sp. A36a-5a]|uniref:hypothetical protein n=1 Tax=Phaeobacter bryozoorum TaxID=1086632 RepID=UPI0035A61E14
MRDNHWFGCGGTFYGGAVAGRRDTRRLGALVNLSNSKGIVFGMRLMIGRS